MKLLEPHGWRSAIDRRAESMPNGQLLKFQNVRVLVIGINYAPEPTGIAPYTTATANFLAKVGATVTVFTGVPHYPSWQVPDHYRGRLRWHEQGNGPDVVRHAHFVPTQQNALSRAWYELTFLLNVLRSVPRRPDVIIGISPSLGGSLAAALLARRLKVPNLTVVQDLMSKAATQSGIAGGRCASGVTAAVERFVLQNSTVVAPVSDAFRPQLLRYGVPEHRIRLLPNWTHIQPTSIEPKIARSRLGWPVDKFLVVHTGNMGLKQDLGNVIEAARKLAARDGIRFVLVGDGSQRRALERQASDLENLTFVDPLSEQDYVMALSASDLLLVNERPSVGDMSLPSKITSYLAAGRPVLAAVNPEGSTGAELFRSKAAVVVAPADPAALADAVHDVAADADWRSSLAEAGLEYATAHLSESTAMDRLVCLLHELTETT